MNFDYTYIALSGFLLFEPMIILTNTIFFALSVWCYLKLRNYKHVYARQMALFMLFLGTSSVFGAVAHTVHYQLGTRFFETVLFLMNALSLLSIYFCFRAAYTYANLLKTLPRIYIYVAQAWVSALLVFSFIKGNFLLIKIHAAIVLVYALIVHLMAVRQKQEEGSRLVVTGLLISFLPIIVHSLKFSLHEWFNYKDIAHVIMIVALWVIFKGVRLNAAALDRQT